MAGEAADPPPGQPPDEVLGRDLDEEARVDPLAAGEERGVERLRLGARCAGSRRGWRRRAHRAVEPLQEHRDGDRVGDELAALHVRRASRPRAVPSRDRRAEQVPGRDVRDPESLREDGRLGALAGTRGPEQDQDPHRMKPS